MTDETHDGRERQAVREYLDRLIAGSARPRDVFAEARQGWLSGQWPGPTEEGYDLIAHEVMFMLADAREMGVSHEDAPALLRYLEGADQEIGERRERLYEHFMSVDRAAREALQLSDDYYGSRTDEGEVESLDVTYSNPAHRRLHRGVRLDPESVWSDVRAFLCQSNNPFGDLNVDLVEDLVVWHSDAFIDRIEALVEECESAALTVAWTQVGGIAGPAIDRFDRLQQRLQSKLAPDGTFHIPRDIRER